MDAKSLREAMKEKAKRLSGATSEKVDASTWTQAEPMDADVKTGMRPISRRAFKVGGKVAGAEAMTHAGRTPRKSGGKTEYANALVNRNVKDANEEREGKKHIGGMKNGGRTAHAEGGTPPMTSSPRPMPRPTPEMMDEMGMLPAGGMKSSPRPMPRPSPARMKEIMAAADEAKAMEALERANRAAERDQYDLRTLGRKRGGKAEKFEGSAKDMMEDKKLAKKHGMTMKEWEASDADKKHDMPSKKMSGGSMGYAAGGKMKMVEKDGKKVPFFAADGVGKMKDGGRTAKMGGGSMGLTSAEVYKAARSKRQKDDEDGILPKAPVGNYEKYKSMSPKQLQKALDNREVTPDYLDWLGVSGKGANLRDIAKASQEKNEDNDRNRGGKAMHHKDCMCKACGGAAMGKKDGGGLYANINAKRERIENGSKEKMRKVGSKGAPTADAFKDSAKTAEKKDGGKAMHHKDCMCKACGGAIMDGGRTARATGGKVGKSNISINIFPHNAEKPGAMPVPPAGMPPMSAPPMMRPPMPPMPAPMPSAPPPAHMSLPPGLMSAMSGAAGAGPMPPAGGAPMPPPMMGRKAGGKVVYPITGGSGGGKARLEKVAAYGEKMNKDLKK